MAHPSGGRPAPHPDPPTDITRRALPITPASGPWIRSHDLQQHPLYFGRSGNNRFDAPGGEFGILYCGFDEEVAFAETFLHAVGSHNRLVAMTELARRTRSLVAAAQPLRLVDLTGSGLPSLGADARLFSGDYGIAQQWSLALFQHPEQPDGLCYRSRIDSSRFSVAIYDRARSALASTLLGSLADPAHHAILARILNVYNVGLV